MPNEDAKLFQPIRVGNLNLAHRVVLAPLTRYRASEAHVPTDFMLDYYSQRASTPGTLLITEATFIAAKAGGYDNIPGIWSDAQVEAWKKIVDAVHARGSYIYLQMWQLGRAADPEVLARPDSPSNPGGPYPFVSASDIKTPEKQDGPTPRPLTHEEILEYIELFGQAAHNAVHRARFDGVEIHAAHGYLIDQFTQDVSNKRTDVWGGSIENRTRFAREVVKKVVSVVGEERTSIRLSPFNTWQGMHMEHPQPTFAYLVSRIREDHPRLSYLHVVEPRVAGIFDRTPSSGESNEFLRAIWKSPQAAQNGSVYFSAGGYTPERALQGAEQADDVIVFGRFFISNPDLPTRIKKGLPLTPYDRKTFYDALNPKGYIDYPFADPEAEAHYKSRKGLRNGAPSEQTPE
ncbi:hypothetical protein ACEPAI_8786 [Sanghuangporus weigelae]